MWEWRVFASPDALAVPRELAVDAAPWEDAREDLYFLLRAAPDTGLKVRSLQLGARCELKRRFARHPAGPEQWEKVFEQRLPVPQPWTDQLLRHLGARPLARPLESADELHRMCAEAGLGEPEIVLVKKRIAKAPIAPAYTIECADLEVVGARTLALRSVAVEAPTLELCLEHGRAAGLPDALGGGEALVAGYPEALARLRARLGS